MAKAIAQTHPYNNCHIPDLVQKFSDLENGGLNLIYSRANIKPKLSAMIKIDKTEKFSHELF